MTELAFTPMTGREAFNAHVATLKPKNCPDGAELWFKLGHGRFLLGEITTADSLILEETALPIVGWDEDGRPIYGESNTRYRTGKAHQNGFDYLLRQSFKRDGGVFYIPTQPIGKPIAECVTETDDIGIENDGLSLDEQKQQLQEFVEVTGLLPVSVLTSGGNSLHSHFKTIDHLPLEQAQYLRRLAILSFLSDPVTERWHQPMRIAPFYRKEKGDYQTLLYANAEARYTFEELTEGFRKWFDHKGWRFPESIADDWWRERFYSQLKGSAKLSPEQKEVNIRSALETGLDGWQAKKEWEERQRQIRIWQREESHRTGVGQLGSLVDLVNETCERLGEAAFLLANHGWVGKAGHKRGLCCNPAHQSKSGNSAWIARNKNGQGWSYHCSACTADKGVSPFLYWRHVRKGASLENLTYPRGKQWVEEAIEFLEYYGVAIPDHCRNYRPIVDENRPKGVIRKQVNTQSAVEVKSVGEVETVELSDVTEPEAEPYNAKDAIAHIDITKPIYITNGSGNAEFWEGQGHQVLAFHDIADVFISHDSQGNEAKKTICAELYELVIRADKKTKIRFVIAFNHFDKFTQRSITHELARLLKANKCYVDVVDIRYPDKIQTYENWQNKEIIELEFEANIQLNERYLPRFKLSELGRLTGIRSPKGSGKTEILKYLVQDALEQGRPILVIGHLVQLVADICRRLGLITAEQLKKALAEVKQANNDLSKSPEERQQVLDSCTTLWIQAKEKGFGVCFNSLHGESQMQFDADDWIGRNPLIIIDEVEQNALSLLDGDHVLKRRAAILTQLERLFGDALRVGGEGQIIVCDADLTNVSIDFIRQLARQPNLKPFIIRNDFNPDTPCTVIRCEKPEDWFAELFKWLDAGKKLFICLDTQKEESAKLTTSTLEADIRKAYPNLKILRIDSDTLGLQDNPAFGCVALGLEDIVQRYDVVIASPSIVTGVSIDIDHFDGVFGHFEGIVNSNSARQQLFRVRRPIPRVVYAAQRGRVTFGGITSVWSLERKLWGKIQCSGGQIDEATAYQGLDFMPVATSAWAKFKSRDNASKVRFADNLFRELEKEGHNVQSEPIALDKKERQIIRKTIKQNREGNKERIAEEVVDAPDISRLPANERQEKLDAKSFASLEEKRSIQRLKIEDLYGVPVTPELARFHQKKGNFEKLRTHYEMTVGEPFSLANTKEKINEYTYNDRIMAPDYARINKRGNIAWYKYLGLDRFVEHFIKTGEYIHKHHPMVEEFIAKITEHEERIATEVDITLSDDVMKTVKSAIAKLGYITKSPGGRQTKVTIAPGLSPNVYLVQPLIIDEDLRADIFQAWLKWDIDKAEKRATDQLKPTWGDAQPKADTIENGISPIQNEVESSRFSNIYLLSNLESGRSEKLEDDQSDWNNLEIPPMDETTPLEESAELEPIDSSLPYQWGNSLSAWYVVRELGDGMVQIYDPYAGRRGGSAIVHISELREVA